MKRLALLLALVPFTFALAACDVPPKTDIADMQSAVDSAIKEGAQQYAPEQLKLVNDQMAAALDEVQKQDSKFVFKNYHKARLLVAKTKTEANTLKEKVATMKQSQTQG